MKFRRLNIEELTALEAEFVQFLSANTITGADWQQLKTDDTQKADQLIDIFSDLVFEKIIKNIDYLAFKTPNDIKIFYCAADKIHLKGIQNSGKTDIDLRDTDKMMAAIQSSTINLQFYSAEKDYAPNRSQEIFRMLENGATITEDGQLFEMLKNL